MSHWIRQLPTVMFLTSLTVLLGAQPAQPKDVTNVIMRDHKYSPVLVTVGVGHTVIWTNRDGADHTVIAVNGEFTSDTLKPNEKFQFKFVKKGTYKYECKLHPRMKGTVIVE